MAWVVENETETVQNSTTEYNYENLTFPQMDMNNLVYVSFLLTWDDRTPVNAVSEGNDNFTLTVWPPGSSGLNRSSEYESIIFDWELNAVPEDFLVEARTEAEARDTIDYDEFEGSLGRGIWDAQVYLAEAGDGLLQDGGILPDSGEAWRLDVTYHYYELTMTELTD